MSAHRRLPALLLIMLVGHPGPACADDIRPLYLLLEERAEGLYTLRVKMPPRIPASNAPRVTLPDYCAATDVPATYRCTRDLSGDQLRLDYPAESPSLSGVLKVVFHSGESHTLLLGAGAGEIVLPNREAGSRIAADYTWMGTHHIWVGYDHLLFLLCLIWIAGSLRRILVTITGFTLAHSVTLALSALQLVRLPVPPIEAAIALSVLFLAVEVVKGGRDSLTWRHPAAVSSSFGLLHGLGFATVLNETGLPQMEVILGLVFFNVGVEIGQVLFAMVAVTLLRALHVLGERWSAGIALHARAQRVMGYGVGCTAAYWLIGRTVSFAL